MHSIIKNDAVNLIYLINKVFMMFSYVFVFDRNLSSEQPLICPNCGETIDQKQVMNNNVVGCRYCRINRTSSLCIRRFLMYLQKKNAVNSLFTVGKIAVVVILWDRSIVSRLGKQFCY